MMLLGLLAMPHQHYVFDPDLAFIAYASEAQCIPSARKTVNTSSVATLRHRTTCSPDSDRIAINGVIAPCVAFPIMIEVHIERAIAVKHPDRAERVDPITQNCLRTGTRGGCASAQNY